MTFLFPRRLLALSVLVVGLASPGSSAVPASIVAPSPVRGAFGLVAGGRPASVWVDPADLPVVRHAAADLVGDIEAVTSHRPLLQTDVSAARRVVMIGTLGHSRAIDALVASGKLDIRRLRGTWEGSLTATVRRPAPGIDEALVIVGSDARGTAYGVYDLSAAIGVSPWTWWADVPALHRAELWVRPGMRFSGSPSVKYRGIFINDEDWGLQPWAARTFEPEAGGLGPKAYTKIFQLLLRLKANTLWPAMHHVSPAFNANPANAKLADDYGIVMGSSHAEPMLRNNVGEWKDDPAGFNYAINRAGVRAYWDERVARNGAYENLWTIGMRGIHDSGMVGAETVAGRIALLDQIITDQRSMLETHLGRKASDIPQMFMPYKEVLDLYRGGLKVPDDVTIVWPDDNFGYIRQFPNAAERARAGGSGIYYHLSYLGAPLSYLWLSTTPPALIMEEMTRAWDAGARTVWIVNVGDIKPAEIGTSLFFELAWDIGRWRGRSQKAFLDDWTERTFGPPQSKPIAAVLDAYFTLNAERRPEHLQAYLPGERPHLGLFTDAQAAARKARFAALESGLDEIVGRNLPDQQDAFFEIVDYPVRAAAEANRRFIASENYARWIEARPADARAAGAEAVQADIRIKALTARFNDSVAGGKWRHLMAEEPADNQWPSFRVPPVALPSAGLRAFGEASSAPVAVKDVCGGVAEAKRLAQTGWTFPAGLGLTGTAGLATAAGATISFEVRQVEGCGFALAILPTFPTEGQTGFDIDLTGDGAPLSSVHIEREAGTRDWSLGVLANRLLVPLPRFGGPGPHRLTVRARQSGLVLDAILLTPPAKNPSSTQ